MQKNYLVGTVDDAFVFANLLVQLQLCLDVFRGVGDADLTPARDAPCDDPLQEGIGTSWVARTGDTNSCTRNLGDLTEINF